MEYTTSKHNQQYISYNSAVDSKLVKGSPIEFGKDAWYLCVKVT